MGERYYLAVDIGASSGRHILSHLENGHIVLEEIYRFSNGNEISDGHRVWNTERLWQEIKEGMKRCAAAGKVPVSMGIDTWGVDYALLDENDDLIEPVYAYRDSRTQGMDEEVYRIIPEDRLYARTGIQKAIYNTIYQLTADRVQEPKRQKPRLERAKTFLMLPDYFHYKLTGRKAQEYTIASTSQLLDPQKKAWDLDLIGQLGLPKELFHELSQPGTDLGPLTQALQQEVGFNCRVVLPASHDTASAVMSVPCGDDPVLYISSGTWSLMGTELSAPNRSEEAHRANFTNEGGYDFRFRFLKNIMGLWMIQSVKKELEEGSCHFDDPDGDHDYSFAHLCERASRETIGSLVDANDGRYLAPDCMTEQVRQACLESGQEVPKTPWQTARVIYRSLAECYGKTAREIEDLAGHPFRAVHIVGGGSKAAWLNELTAQTTGLKALAGPAEATAIGNLGAQMIASGELSSLKALRQTVADSLQAGTIE